MIYKRIDIIRKERAMQEFLTDHDGHNRLMLLMSEAEEGRKLLSVLRSVPGLSHAKIGSLKYDPEGLLLNGERTTVSAFLHAGDRVHILLDDSENRVPHLLSNPLPLQILYEDSNLIILNKPAGQVCHPSKGHLIDSLANALLSLFESAAPRASIHFVGRLDKDTSGLVTVAKNGITAERMNLLKADGCLCKTYLAIASGCFPDPEKEGVIDIPMEEYRTEDNVLKNRRGSALSGQPALTRYKVIGEARDLSLLEVQIDTGRMHQIRFHMAEIGHPLLGDPIYGEGPCELILRTALHAQSLRFRHPYTGEELHIEAPVPEDMQSVIRQITVS